MKQTEKEDENKKEQREEELLRRYRRHNRTGEDIDMLVENSRTGSHEKRKYGK